MQKYLVFVDLVRFYFDLMKDLVALHQEYPHPDQSSHSRDLYPIAVKKTYQARRALREKVNVEVRENF